jgi:hypothetical protein
VTRAEQQEASVHPAADPSRECDETPERGAARRQEPSQAQAPRNATQVPSQEQAHEGYGMGC